MPHSSLRSNGALGVSFLVCRALQFACLIAAMGMTANLVSVMVDAIQQPPTPIIGLLCITCFATLYVIITYVLWYDNQLPKHYTAVSDGLFFIALMITAIVIGKPLSYLSCKAVSAMEVGADTAASSTYINEGYHAKRANIYMMPVNYEQWLGGAGRTCDMMKAVWGLMIVLTVLFAFSTACLAFLWKKESRPQTGKHYAVDV